MIQSTPLTLNDLFARSGVDPAEVLVVRHRPFEQALNDRLPQLALQRPDLFNCYQSVHGPRAEAALTKASYLATFIRHEPTTALFIGLYAVAARTRITVAECVARPAYRELLTLGMTDFATVERRETLVAFDLENADWHCEWAGKLIVRWPPPDRSWYRWAGRNSFEMQAVSQENLLDSTMPPWHDLILSWSELQSKLLPSAWAAALAQWRGVYLIIDQADGLAYVGSASGAQNILQRWHDYARTGHGGNRGLIGRDPTGFRFSILQLTAPDLAEKEVVALEASWKRRLRTAAPYGLNEN